MGSNRALAAGSKRAREKSRPSMQCVAAPFKGGILKNLARLKAAATKSGIESSHTPSKRRASKERFGAAELVKRSAR